MSADLKTLVKKWEPVLNEGRKYKNDKVKKATAIMLENQFNWLAETGLVSENMSTFGANTAPGTGASQNMGLNRSAGMDKSGDFWNIAIPMVRRTFPELIAHEIVGVQPMTGPVGLAFALRYRSGNDYADLEGNVQKGVELGHNSVDPRYSGSYPTSAGEGLGSVYDPTSGSGTGIGGNHPTVAKGLGIGEGKGIKEVNLTIEKAQVEARTRKLRSRWSLEVAQDIKAMHGLELEEEMMDILVYEITAEIDRELIDVIDSLCNVTTGIFKNMETVDYQTDLDGRWEAERYRNIYNLLIRKSNRIAYLTRRGAGNWVVANPTVCAAFEALSAFTIAPVNEDVNTAIFGVSKLGSLDGRLTCYRDTFQQEDQFIIGYKGPSEYDTGVIYLPYIQLMLSKATFEDSFHPTIGLMSRYAIHHHMFGSKDFYQKVSLENMNSPLINPPLNP